MKARRKRDLGVQLMIYKIIIAYRIIESFKILEIKFSTFIDPQP